MFTEKFVAFLARDVPTMRLRRFCGIPLGGCAFLKSLAKLSELYNAGPGGDSSLAKTPQNTARNGDPCTEPVSLFWHSRIDTLQF